MMTWKWIARRQCSEHKERCNGRGNEGKGHLGELVSDFFNLFALLADDCPMELLIHNQIFGAFVLLPMGVQSLEASTFKINKGSDTLKALSPFSGPSRGVLGEPAGLPWGPLRSGPGCCAPSPGGSAQTLCTAP